MEISRRTLSIDMVVGWPILKTSENKTPSHFTFTPKWGIGVLCSKRGLFLSAKLIESQTKVVSKENFASL